MVVVAFVDLISPPVRILYRFLGKGGFYFGDKMSLTSDSEELRINRSSSGGVLLGWRIRMAKQRKLATHFEVRDPGTSGIKKPYRSADIESIKSVTWVAVTLVVFAEFC